MSQINFRIAADEKYVISSIAKEKGISVAEFAKRELLKNIEKERVDFAFELQKDGKISRKRTWKLSGLSGSEFLDEWSKRGAVENIPDDIYEKSLELSRTIDFTPEKVNVFKLIGQHYFCQILSSL